MGIRCSVLPTAVLSTHTGFPKPEVLPLTDHLGSFAAHWETVGITFDAVTTGYMADAMQAEAVLPLLKKHKAQGSVVIVDPAMGDHGKLYSRLDAAHVQAMAELCRNADILLPNVTEAALLTGLPYRDQADAVYGKELADALLEKFPAEAVLITGIHGSDGTIGFVGRHRSTGHFSYETPVIPRQFHGTGDLFAAVFAGAALHGADPLHAGMAAADFVRACVAETPEVTPHGVDFESQLYRLFPTTFQHT
jgi:pyridoxine kinase